MTHGGADIAAVSTGVFGAKGKINAPSVYNAALNFAQFWDGRAQTLEEQALVPIQNQHEMGMSLANAVSVLANDAEYHKAFSEAFGSEPTPQSIGAAIAEYERSLLTPESPFDRYLRGDSSAIADDAKHGYLLFKSYGCVACHQGRNVGGNMFQKFGIMGDYFADRGKVSDEDLGRFNVTQKESDRYVFKVPSLRNVALTAPYFHDGSADTLEKAIVVMGRYQLGRELSEADVADLSAFLRTLTGDQPQ